MKLQFRSVQLGSPRQLGEGLRIGTVRRPPRGVPKSEYRERDFFDVWLPILAYQCVLIPATAVLGLYLSMICRSTARAMLVFLPIAGIGALAPAGIYLTFDAITIRGAWIASLLLLGTLLVLGSILWVKLQNGFARDGGGFDGGR